MIHNLLQLQPHQEGSEEEEDKHSFIRGAYEAEDGEKAEEDVAYTTQYTD